MGLLLGWLMGVHLYNDEIGELHGRLCISPTSDVIPDPLYNADALACHTGIVLCPTPCGMGGQDSAGQTVGRHTPEGW
jgi:hypothetical protein